MRNRFFSQCIRRKWLFLCFISTLPSKMTQHSVPICHFPILLPRHTLPKITLNIYCNIFLPFKNSILISIQNNGFCYDMFMYVNHCQLIMPILLLTSLTPLIHPTGSLPLLNISPYIYIMSLCVQWLDSAHEREHGVFFPPLMCPPYSLLIHHIQQMHSQHWIL